MPRQAFARAVFLWFGYTLTPERSIPPQEGQTIFLHSLTHARRASSLFAPQHPRGFHPPADGFQSVRVLLCFHNAGWPWLAEPYGGSGVAPRGNVGGCPARLPRPQRQSRTRTRGKRRRYVCKHSLRCFVYTTQRGGNGVDSLASTALLCSLCHQTCVLLVFLALATIPCCSRRARLDFPGSVARGP